MDSIKITLLLIILMATNLSASINKQPKVIVVKTQVTGFLNTNCYLIYDANKKEAALIDPGDEVDSLIALIKTNNLALKYIYLTHCHPDHMYGILSMNLKDKFPNAKICFSEEGYQDMFEIVAKWKEVYPEHIVNMIESSADASEIFNMDFEKIGKPDVYIKDKQVFTLGEFKIQALKTPGHARGSISFYVQNIVFSGDELQSGKVGGTDISPISSFDTQVQSIRRLYTILPDETIVYPGHGNSTTIGYEKLNNRSITLERPIN